MRSFLLKSGNFLLVISVFLLPDLYGQNLIDKPYITMEVAIERALSVNNQIRASHYAVKKATWDWRHTWSLLMPTLTFNSQITWIDDQSFAERDFRRYLPDELKEQFPQTVFQQSYYTSLSATMPLFNAPILNSLFMSKANQKMTIHMDRSTKQQIIFRVISSYLTVLKSKELLQLQEEYLNLSRMNYEKAKRLQAAGRYSRTDVLRWQVDYQQQKSLAVQNQSILRSSMTQLNRLLNLNMHRPVEIEGHIPRILLQESRCIMQLSDIEILSMIELENRKLIQANAVLSATQSSTKMNQLVFKNSYNSYLPSLAVSYSYGWRENSTFALDDYSPQMLLFNLRMPLFTGFQNLTSVKSSYYQYKQSQEQFEDQLQNIRFLLIETANRIINLKNQRELTKTNVEFSEQNYHVVAQQKERGLVSNIDFIDAKLNMQKAELDEIDTHYDFISGFVELYYLLGKIESLCIKE